MSAATTSVGLVRDTLDDLEVTDTVFHDLAFTLPLTAILIDKISARPHDDRVLLIGPNVALAKVLVAEGRDVSIWHVPGVALTEDLGDRVTRKGTLDALLDPVGAGIDTAGSFDVIVAPYVIDAATAEPAVALATLHAIVAPTGVILVAVRRGGIVGVAFRRGTGPLGSARRRGRRGAALVELADGDAPATRRPEVVAGIGPPRRPAHGRVRGRARHDRSGRGQRAPRRSVGLGPARAFGQGVVPDPARHDGLYARPAHGGPRSMPPSAPTSPSCRPSRLWSTAATRRGPRV